MSVSKDIQSDGGISDLCGGGQFIDGKAGDTVYKDMVFITPVEFKFVFTGLVGCGTNAEFTVRI